MQNVTQNAKILILNQVVCSCSLNCGKGAEGKRSPNLLLVCLQLLLPVNDQWLSKGDRELVDWCRGRLGEVCAVCCTMKDKINEEWSFLSPHRKG